jgi:NAD(P)H dehydrogenase (quinone)
MSKVLIAYYSRGGNTAKMASLVKAGAEAAGATASCRSAEELKPSDFLDYDGIVLGSPTYYGAPAAEIKKLLDETVKYHGRLAGKVGGAFSSVGGIGGGAETTIRGLLDALLIHGMIVEGCYQGGHYGPVAVGEPDDRAARECRALGERVARLVKRLAKK